MKTNTPTITLACLLLALSVGCTTYMEAHVKQRGDIIGAHRSVPSARDGVDMIDDAWRRKNLGKRYPSCRSSPTPEPLHERGAERLRLDLIVAHDAYDMIRLNRCELCVDARAPGEDAATPQCAIYKHRGGGLLTKDRSGDNWYAFNVVCDKNTLHNHEVIVTLGLRNPSRTASCAATDSQLTLRPITSGEHIVTASIFGSVITIIASVLIGFSL
ncbi:MAG: hypothetical protein AAFX99_20805 [Myxococcota bacterium]